MNESGPDGSDLALDESQLAMVLATVPDAVLVLDALGRVRFGNPAAERLWGRSLEAAIGMSALELIHPDDAEFTFRSLESIQAKDVGELIEVRTITPEGWRLVEVLGSRAPGIGRGSVVFSIRDVTERRRFEVAHGSDEKFRSILQNSAYVSMLVTPERVVESVSSSVTRLFGHDPEAVEGTPLAELFEPGCAAVINGALDDALAVEEGEAPITVTVTAECRDFRTGLTVPVELSIVSLVSDPTLSGCVVSMRDVSELAKAEQSIREALSLLAATIESTADGLLVVDGAGRIVSYNQRFAEMWQIPQDLLDTRDDDAALEFVLSQLVEPDEFLSGVRLLYEDRGAESFDSLSFLDGRTFERYSRPQRVGEDIVGRVWSFRDVTERVRLEGVADDEHRRLIEAQDVARLGTFEMSFPDGLIFWSAPFRTLIGVHPDEDPSIERFVEQVHPEDRQQIADAVAESVRSSDGAFEAICRVAGPDGDERWIQIRTRGMFEADGTLSKLLGTAIDVTDRQENEAARRDAERRFRLGYENSTVPSAMLDLETVVTSVNPALCSWLGLSREQLIGRDAVDIVHPDDRDSAVTTSRVLSGQSAPIERRLRTADGSYVYGLVNLTLISHDDGTPAYLFAQIQDITERKRFEQALEHMAFHDPLTGLPNRALLQDRLEVALARSARNGTQVAVIFADIDRFKLVNDTLGHAAGDRLLVDLAARLRGVTRAADTIGRFGGDEFVMICEDVDLSEGAHAIGRRMAAAFDEPFRVAERDVYMTLSAGIVLPENEAAGATCLRDGDVAMYRAKERGGGRSELFTPDMLSSVAMRLDLETALRRAIESEDLSVAYQPIVDLATDRVVALEALCRWTHPVYGEMSPAEFIRVAEQSGLILPLGRFVTNRAVRQITTWRRELSGGADLTVSINVSSAELSWDLVTRCLQLNDAGAEAGSYHFEITESVLMSDVDVVIDVLRRLAELGVTVSIDDFGTGYSSLEYLRLLPVHSLKIDQGFVAVLEQEDSPSPSIVRAVVALADALGLGSCAEGVETEEQRQALVDLGCETGQGYLWAKAMAPADFERWWESRQAEAPAGTLAP